MNKGLKNRVNKADDVTFSSNEYSSNIGLTDSARHARLGSTVFIIFKTGLTNMTIQSYVAYIHGTPMTMHAQSLINKHVNPAVHVPYLRANQYTQNPILSISEPN